MGPERPSRHSRQAGFSMKPPATARLAVAAVFFALAGPASAQGPGADPGDFYTRKGSDPPFGEIMERGLLPRGRNSRGGVQGSRITVNESLIRGFPYADRQIDESILIHTLGHSAIPRGDFGRWSRWYQEDGRTQVFRLFKGETNVRNERQLAARIEAFSRLGWGEGAWHEWSGVYTIIKPHGCMIFQVKNNRNDWAVSLGLGSNGDIKLNHRRGKDKIIARDMVGKPFHIFVRDNGRDYMLYLNGKLQGEGSYPRPAGSRTNFRWGMYLGANEVRHDAMLLVTGATVDPRGFDLSKFESLPARTGPPPAETGPGASPEPSTPKGLPIPERTWRNADGSAIKAAAVYQVGEDSVHLKIGDRWIRYALADLSAADRRAVLIAGEFAGAGDPNPVPQD